MDKYQQREELRGLLGNSPVYRAIRLSDNVNVALKRVRGWDGLQPADQESALSEITVLKSLDHPHIIKLLDRFSDRGDLCLVMPLYQPGSRVFESAALPLSPSAVARAGYQLVCALSYMHGKTPPLLHRDIKPANLLLAAAPGTPPLAPGPLTSAQASALVCGGTLVLADFGSSLALQRTLATGTNCGTTAYKAGEILRMDEYAAPADVWSCGVALLELATGHVAGGTNAACRAIMAAIPGGAEWTLQGALDGAFHDKFDSAAMEAKWGEKCAAQRAAWTALGADLQGVIERCLVPDAALRAKAADLVEHAAFSRERRAGRLQGALWKLEQQQAPAAELAPEELLAVLEAGASIPEAAFERICRAVEGLPPTSAGEAMCSALLEALRSGRAPLVAPAASALLAQHDKGNAAALAATYAGNAVLLGLVASGGAAEASLTAQLSAARAGAEELGAQSRACGLEKARLSQHNAELRGQADSLSAEMAALRDTLARQQAATVDLQSQNKQLADGKARQAAQYEELRVKYNSLVEPHNQLAARNAQLQAQISQLQAQSAQQNRRFSGLDNFCLAIKADGEPCMFSNRSTGPHQRCGHHSHF